MTPHKAQQTFLVVLNLRLFLVRSRKHFLMEGGRLGLFFWASLVSANGNVTFS